jgi:hypothetical protein
MQRTGGEFNLYIMEDDRILSSLLIPLAAKVPTVKQSPEIEA